MARILLPTNDRRSEFLETALATLGHQVVPVAFDDVDFITKALAAVATLNSPRSEWWESYQTHPLVQSRRERVFRARVSSQLPADLVISWGSWFAPKTASRSAVPFVFYIDQSRSTTPEPQEARGVLPRPRSGNRRQLKAYESATKVYCMSQWAVQQTLRAHAQLSPHAVEWAGWGPCAFDDSSTSRERPSGAPIVLLVANDFRRKGVDWFVRTAAIVKSTRPEVRFVLIGADQSSSGYALGEQIEYIGPVKDRAKLLDWFRASSVFFLPNRFDRSPHVLIEALSVGLPIVVSRQGGASELAQEGAFARSVEPGDIEGYSDAILHYLSSESNSQMLSVAAKSIVRNKYNWLSVATRLTSSLHAGSKRPALEERL